MGGRGGRSVVLDGLEAKACVLHQTACGGCQVAVHAVQDRVAIGMHVGWVLVGSDGDGDAW